MHKFWNEERGQDLIEYTLFMAFVALAMILLFWGAGSTIKNIWTSATCDQSQASTVNNPCGIPPTPNWPVIDILIAGLIAIGSGSVLVTLLSRRRKRRNLGN